MKTIALVLASLLLASSVWGAPPPAAADEQAFQPHHHQHRERRLQRAVERGLITPAEARALRERWAQRDALRERFLKSLTPEQKQLFQAWRRAAFEDFDDRPPPPMRGRFDDCPAEGGQP